MQRKATAVWEGTLQEGKGALSTESGVLSNSPYSFKTRFEEGKGTNPEELLAAAHAGCFTMALSFELTKLGAKPQKLETIAAITLSQGANGFTITKSHLTLTATVPGIDKEKFNEAVKTAETGCPVSKLFKAEITVDATLVE